MAKGRNITAGVSKNSDQYCFHSFNSNIHLEVATLFHIDVTNGKNRPHTELFVSDQSFVETIDDLKIACVCLQEV